MNPQLLIGNTWGVTAEATTTTPPPVRIDDEILARARRGDEEAFCQLIEPEEDRLLRQALALGNEIAAAEDLVQDTLIAAWKSLARFAGRCQLFTWLYAIMLRLHRKRLRSLRRKPLLFYGLFQWSTHHPEATQDSSVVSEDTPASAAAAAEEHRRLRTLIESLPAKHRDMIRLRFYASASLEEIAHVTGCSLGTVKSRLHYALEKLRRKNTHSHP